MFTRSILIHVYDLRTISNQLSKKVTYFFFDGDLTFPGFLVDPYTTSGKLEISFHFHSFLTSSSATRLFCERVTRLTSSNFTRCYTETEREGRDFCLSRSCNFDIDPTSRERAPGSGIEPTTS